VKRYPRHTGPPDQYDYMGAMQFCNLFLLGMRHFNTLLDFGCGNLRLGRLAIQYLDKDNYSGIEPVKSIVIEGIEKAYLRELCKAKNPGFHFSDDCDMSVFNKKFDYIIAQSVFTHMARSQIDSTLRSAEKVMHKKSLFLVNYHPGKEDYDGKGWTQKITKYRPETINKIVEKNGLVLTSVHLIHTHLQNWLLIRK